MAFNSVRSAVKPKPTLQKKSVGKIEGIEQEKERKEERAADKEAIEDSTRSSFSFQFFVGRDSSDG